MEQAELMSRQRRHNLLAMARAAGWACIAIVSWFISWWLCWWIFGVFFWLWQGLTGWAPTSRACNIAAWVGCGLLAIEGIRSSRTLFDINSYSNSFYSSASVPGPTSYLTGNPMGSAYLVSQILFIAPRSTVKTIAALRSMVFMDNQTLSAGEVIMQKLFQNRYWQPVTEHIRHPQALASLDKMGLIIHRVHGDEVQVRLNHDAFPNAGPPT